MYKQFVACLILNIKNISTANIFGPSVNVFLVSKCILRSF